MQIIFEDKDERNNSRRTNLIDLVIYTGRICRCVEGEFIGGFRIRRSRIWISRRKNSEEEMKNQSR